MSLDNFKNFVKENPKLANFVRNGDMTWQKFYELYDLYGPFHDIWNKYLGITTNGVFSFKDMFNVFKSLDMNEVQKGISSLQKGIGYVQDFISNREKKESDTKNLLMNLDLFLRILMINECRNSDRLKV